LPCSTAIFSGAATCGDLTRTNFSAADHDTKNLLVGYTPVMQAHVLTSYLCPRGYTTDDIETDQPQCVACSMISRDSYTDIDQFLCSNNKEYDQTVSPARSQQISVQSEYLVAPSINPLLLLMLGNIYSFEPPATDASWTGLVLNGKENSHSQYAYIATLFDSVRQKGLFIDTLVGYFESYDNTTASYTLGGGGYCSVVRRNRGGKVYFHCAKATVFSIVEQPTCFYTMRYYSPTFCSNGTYTYGPHEPTLYPTRQPSPSPTLLSVQVPAYATLSEEYVKSVLLSVADGSWADTNSWSADDALEDWHLIVASVDDNGYLDAPFEIYHGQKLYTSFPTELALLKDGISVLSLAACELSSTLPSYLADFVYLERLVLYGNSLYGTIPAGLGNISTIREIYLNDNEFTGPVPNDMFLRADLVNLDGNVLTGTIPSSFGSTLESLYLSGNHLDGTLPPTMGSSSLQSVDFSTNWITGKIPVSLCELDLFSLMLGNNKLGCYPTCLSVGVSDVTSYYSRCPGGVDTALCQIGKSFNVSTTLESIIIPGTVFSYATTHPLGYVWEAKVPYEAAGARSLHVSFGCLSELTVSLVRIYDAGGNGLFDASALDSSTIPGCGSQPPLILENVTSIKLIYSNWEPMETYGFTFTVTPQYTASGWVCDNEYAGTSYDDFSGDTYAYAGNFCGWYGVTCESDISLAGIDLSAIGLDGSLPDTVGLLDTIQVFKMGYNNIVGTLPSTIAQLDNLVVLDLEYNMMTGTVPTTVGRMSSLTNLILESNDLHGTIPSQIAQLTGLTVLNLGNNYFSGSVPVQFATMTQVQILDLSTNSLEGKLPSVFCGLLEGDTSSTIYLQDNQFTCYESHCYENRFGNDTGSIKLDRGVSYCAPTSMPTSIPSRAPSSVPTGGPTSTPTGPPTRTPTSPPSRSAVGHSDSRLGAGPLAGIVVGGVVVLLVGYSCLRQRAEVKYLGLPIHKAIATGSLVTEEMLLAHRDTVNTLVDDESIVELVLRRQGKCNMSGIVLAKLIMIRMIAEDARIQEEELLKDGLQRKSLSASQMQLPHVGIEMVQAASSTVAAATQNAFEAVEEVGEELVDTVLVATHSAFEAAEGIKDGLADILMLSDRSNNEEFRDTHFGYHHPHPHRQHHHLSHRTHVKYEDWVSLVQEEDGRSQEAVFHILQSMPEKISLLSVCEDDRGRRCVDVASIACKEILRRCSFLCYRYEIKAGPPEHISATSAVVFATDHGEWTFRPVSEKETRNELLKDKEGVASTGFLGKQVCLKFMRNREQYLTEIEVRSKSALDPEFVIAVLVKYDGDAEDEAASTFRKGAVSKGFENYPYCVVMEKADQSLKRIIDHNHIVGEDWDAIKTIFKQVVNAVDHLHKRKIIHGDLKPMNIMQGGGRMLLIDMDAAASFKEGDDQFAGTKYSSAYLPPEFLVIGQDGNAAVRVPPVGYASDLQDPPYTLIKADPSLDMWSLGALLYLLCTGMNLFRATVEDNVGSDPDMRLLMEWTIQTKEECLSVVKDKLGRNLISLLLAKDPLKRLDCAHVLSHPFLAGKQPGRLQGERAGYDVFLSYRVSSDSAHVKLLHDLLEAKGLNVWWDKKCLLPGQPWEEGFCAGLANSSHFVCLLSRGAINSEKPWENFSKLETGSRCDNVLLEWRLALELKRRNMIEGVFPIMIGDRIEDAETKIVSYTHYFQSGCHPSGLPACSVSQVEYKLREHLEREGLGHPFEEAMTVAGVVSEVLANQGGFVYKSEESWEATVGEIMRMIHVTNERHSAEYEAGAAVKETGLKEKYLVLLKEFEDLQKKVEQIAPQSPSGPAFGDFGVASGDIVLLSL
jgi:serine/threonine protein kinase